MFNLEIAISIKTIGLWKQISSFCLSCRRHSKCGLWTCRGCVSWEVVRNVKFQLPPLPPIMSIWMGEDLLVTHEQSEIRKPWSIIAVMIVHKQKDPVRFYYFSFHLDGKSLQLSYLSFCKCNIIESKFPECFTFSHTWVKFKNYSKSGHQPDLDK